MGRRKFMAALGGASGASWAGCADIELAETSPDESLDRTDALERERGLLLYWVGTMHVNQAEAAADQGVYSDKYAGATLDYRELTSYHGRAAAYYDSAATCFEQAWNVLSALEDLPNQDPVDACDEAHFRATHLGRAQVHYANRYLEEPLPVEGETASTPTPTEYSGMEPAQPTEDDDSMQVAQPQEGLHHPGVEDQTVLAEDHYEKIKGFEFQDVETVRTQLGLADG